MDLLQGLNDAQSRAVETTDGPLLVLAGAGSGKTKTLVHRIANIIAEKKAEPEQILAVTFTNKAAKEMRSRIAELLAVQNPGRNFMPFMGTFHGICVRLLRIDGESIGIPKSFIIFDSDDSRGAVKQVMKQLKIDPKQYNPRRIAGLISGAKNQLITAEEYAGTANGQAQKIAAEVYPRYQKLLSEAKALDFDDLLMKTVHMFQRDETVRKKWQQQFRYILIDEYQDTNNSQYTLAKILAADHQNLCVVGDDWQSIYSWRGADFRNILNFHRDYPNVITIKLEQNYRSTKAIVNGASKVIEKNTKRSEKIMRTENDDGQPISIIQTFTEKDEAERIISVLKTFKARGRTMRDAAILYRTNAQSRVLEESFIRYNIPYRIVGGTRFYDRKEIKDVIAYLRLIFQPNDIVSFNRIINTPPRGVGAKSLQSFLDKLAVDGDGQLSLTGSAQLPELMAQVEMISGVSPQAKKGIKNVSMMLSQLRDLYFEGASVAELIRAVLARTNYERFLDDGSPQAEDRQDNVKELISVAEQQAELGLAGFLEEVSLISDIDGYDESVSAVTLMTMHAAKGLEFPVVFMIGLEEGIFPHSNSFLDHAQLEEERRLCYVGMTRAREELYMLHATSRMLFGSTQSNPPSRFLAEIDESYTDKSVQSFGAPSISREEFVDVPKIEVSEGQRVRHPVFGIGVIIEVDEMMATVSFAKGGRKSLNMAFAPLEKI
jgi:DNA helicase-2/ATP-dependent DNA helicase PcrA